MFDSVKFTLIAGMVALVCSVILLGYFAYENTGSRNISFAVAALAAAMLNLGLNLTFDLQRPEPKTTRIPTEYTLDARTPRIRQWVYPIGLDFRYLNETTASAEALQLNPEAFTWRGQKLANDMIIFSILTYLVEEHDWQAKKDVTMWSIGTSTQTTYPSNEKSCSFVSYDDFRNKLSNSGNIFSKFKWYSPFNRICLPPNTTISITSSSVTVSNRFCDIVFDVEPSGGFAGRPTRRDDNPMLENGEPQFWTWRTPIRVTTQYSGLRAQHRDKQKYQDWAENLVEGLRQWFVTSTGHSAVSFNADEENSENALKVYTSGVRN
jgi:hypothetical protein